MAALGSDTWEHLMGSNSFSFLPTRGTPTPLAAFQGLISLWVVGAGQSQGGGCQLGLGFAAGALRLPATPAGSTQTHTAAQTPPMPFIPLIQALWTTSFQIFKAKPMILFHFVTMNTYNSGNQPELTAKTASGCGLIYRYS